jgi:hypothetical protein
MVSVLHGRFFDCADAPLRMTEVVGMIGSVGSRQGVLFNDKGATLIV